MEKYDYLAVETQDVIDYINSDINLADYESREDAEEQLHDLLWDYDNVTGGGIGTYTFGQWEAEENLAHNWDLISEMLTGFGEPRDVNPFEKGAEWCDMSIRCYLLPQAISNALDEIDYKFSK